MHDQELQRAYFFLQQSRFKEALAELQNLTVKDPGNAEVLRLMSICFNSLEKKEEAYDCIKRALSLQPDNSVILYTYSVILFNDDKHNEAIQMISTAVSFDPNEADYFGLWANILLHQKNYEAALEKANMGLSLDPEDTTCLNMRSTALIKLDKKEEAFITVEKALESDPENSYTHSNVGWGYLEKGQQEKALEHFMEALKFNPNNEHARSGLIQALKAKYWFYRLFLKYYFWIGNMKSNQQWIIIGGAYVLIRVLRGIARTNPEAEPFITPIIILYSLFAFSTWVLEPLSNVFLRFNKYGKFALNAKEKKSSLFVGISLVTGLCGLLLFMLSGLFPFLTIGIFGISMMIPLSRVYHSSPALRYYAIGMLIAGSIACILSFGGDASDGLFTIFAGIYLLGIFLYQFIANGIIMKKG